MSEKYNLIKDVDSQFPTDIKQILVEPVLADKSEYVKENENMEDINIKTIFESDDNIILIGKKESGKTTILQEIGLVYIDEHETRGIIPIHINMKHLAKGKDRLLTSCIIFIMNNILDSTSINKENIKKIIEEGNVVFLIDNVKINNVDHTIWLKQFITEYGNNRFILTIEEEFFQSLDIKQIPEYGMLFREIYIQNMGKSEIREMVTRWAGERKNAVDVNDVVNKIDLYCNQINFAKTPFNIAIFIIIWDHDNNFIPVNEGIVMQRYLEIVLEKLSLKEADRNTYSFLIKENFLSFLAHEMYLKNEYYFTQEEFEKLTYDYHIKKGYNLVESKFDVIFFEKNILSHSAECVVFSHTSILEYYLAIYATNDKEFLEEITSKGNRINFRNEICFYSGLKQDCTELLDNLSYSILDTVIDNLDLVDELNNMEIMAEFKMDKEKLIDELQKNRLSQNELDCISDKENSYKEKKPDEISKVDVNEDNAEDFFSLLQMYGSIIKNAELLDNTDKISHLENYMYGMNMLYGMIIKLFECMNKDFKFVELTDIEKKQFDVNSEEEFEKVKTDMVDVTKLIFPIAIQNLILESVGTPKLDAAINELIKHKKEKPFEKFMLAFLKCDLKLVNLKSMLGRYIKNEESKSILKIMMIKLTFYYRSRFFGNNKQIDAELLDLITDIHMKLNPTKKQNLVKSKITQQLKNKLDKTGTCG